MKTQPQCFILTPMPDVASAMAYLAEHRPQRTFENGEPQNPIEIQLRFNNGAKIDAAFPEWTEAIAYLRSFA